MSSENDGKLMVNLLNFYYPARVTQKVREIFAPRYFLYLCTCIKQCDQTTRNQGALLFFPVESFGQNNSARGAGRMMVGEAHILLSCFLKMPTKLHADFPHGIVQDNKTRW